MGVTGRELVNLPVEGVAENAEGGCSEGETSPSFLYINNYKRFKMINKEDAEKILKAYNQEHILCQ